MNVFKIVTQLGIVLFSILFDFALKCEVPIRTRQRPESGEVAVFAG